MLTSGPLRLSSSAFRLGSLAVVAALQVGSFTEPFEYNLTPVSFGYVAVGSLGPNDRSPSPVTLAPNHPGCAPYRSCQVSTDGVEDRRDPLRSLAWQALHVSALPAQVPSD